ncbi:MAG: SH3 domain-containing protein [Chloroflexi bacterium]|nr:SH3 domain-containing protein [Chloroflexota bacterium]
MDETDESNLPPGLSPQPGPTIPTSRRDPPLLEELAAGPAPQEPPQQPPVDGGRQPGEQFDWLAPLHNRFIIAGVSLLILLALTAVVLLVFSRGDGDPGTGPRVGVIGDDPTTPAPIDSLTAIALATTTLHNGPGTNFPPLGTVRRGTRVPIVGRNEDGTWLQVVFPPGSAIRGWIEITFLEVTGDLTEVSVAGPGSGPSIIVPTSVFEEPTNTPIPADTPVPADTPADEPANTPEPSTTPLETETPPPIETPAPTATQAPPPTETPVGVPDSASPTKGKPKASADGLTAPATLTRRPQLSMIPSGVTR